MIKQILLLGFGERNYGMDRGIRQHYAPDYCLAHETRGSFARGDFAGTEFSVVGQFASPGCYSGLRGKRFAAQDKSYKPEMKSVEPRSTEQVRTPVPT